MYEEAILDMQLAFEETYQQTVTRIFPEQKKVILLDRGIMDIKAFMPDDEFKAILKKEINRGQAQGPVQRVIHLVTAAEGALLSTQGENNSARIETPEEARTIDQKIRESWLGHPHFRIIDNSTDFEGKITRTFSAISHFLDSRAPSYLTEIPCEKCSL